MDLTAVGPDARDQAEAPDFFRQGLHPVREAVIGEPLALPVLPAHIHHQALQLLGQNRVLRDGAGILQHVLLAEGREVIVPGVPAHQRIGKFLPGERG